MEEDFVTFEIAVKLKEKGFRTNKDNIRYTLAWCKLSDIKPYKEKIK